MACHGMRQFCRPYCFALAQLLAPTRLLAMPIPGARRWTALRGLRTAKSRFTQLLADARARRWRARQWCVRSLPPRREQRGFVAHPTRSVETPLAACRAGSASRASVLPGGSPPGLPRGDAARLRGDVARRAPGLTPCTTSRRCIPCTGGVWLRWRDSVQKVEVTRRCVVGQSRDLLGLRRVGPPPAVRLAHSGCLAVWRCPGVVSEPPSPRRRQSCGLHRLAPTARPTW